MNKYYLCIDLKSFYASVECVEANLDPFKVALVVADPRKGQGAITLAATPAIKKLGVKSRGRLYEIPPHIDYMIALPRMRLYMEYSAKIYGILLQFIAKEDIHVYSIDESFIDVTSYQTLYQKNAKEIAKLIINRIFEETKITATVGIGTNLYLAKVALDIEGKHADDNIGILDEESYKKKLWHHKPITDFWRIGDGIAKRLASIGIEDMYGIAHCSSNILFQMFGINAQYLIDHANGIEPIEIKDIKAYRPKQNSISSSQILMEDYTYENGLLVLSEMVEINVLTLTEKFLVTNQIHLFIAYSKNKIPPSRISYKLNITTNSYSYLLKEFQRLYRKIVNPNYSIRQIAITFQNVKNEIYEQYDLFCDLEAIEKEKKIQRTLVSIRNKYGKNAVLKGMNTFEKATTKKRNNLIGGHNA